MCFRHAHECGERVWIIHLWTKADESSVWKRRERRFEVKDLSDGDFYNSPTARFQEDAQLTDASIVGSRRGADVDRLPDLENVSSVERPWLNDLGRFQLKLLGC